MCVDLSLSHVCVCVCVVIAQNALSRTQEKQKKKRAGTLGGLALGAERSDRKRKVMESSFSRSLKHATLRYGVRDLLVYEAFRRRVGRPTSV